MDRTQPPRRRTVSRQLAAVLLTLAVLLVPGIAGAQDAIPLKPIEDPTFGVSTVVPEGWTALGQGLYARRPNAADSVVLAVQSAPIDLDQLWTGMLPRLGLKEPPAALGSRSTDAMEWTLYQVDVAAPSGTLRVDLATAQLDGTTYLVLSQGPPADEEVLHDQVFLPVIDALTPLAPEPTVDPATLPYDALEVTFPGGAADITLAGTLTVPRTAGPHPAIVLFTGSGAEDRDESLRPLAAIKPFALLADAFTRAGIAVLRYDDRGVGGSTGDAAATRLADSIADATAAFTYLRSRPEVDPERAGVLGHSEGGIYVASLIETGAPLAFAVGMAPPATNGVDLMVAQNGAVVRTSGSSAEEVQAAEVYARKLYEETLAGDTDAAMATAREYFGGYYDRQTPELQTALGDRTAFIEAQVQTQVGSVNTPSYVDLLRSDASVGWAAATIPVLGVFGGKDVQVVATQNAPLMRAAIQGRNPASEVVILPDANHLFQAAVTGGLAEYGTLAQTFTPDFLPLVVGWVAQQVGLPAPAASAAP